VRKEILQVVSFCFSRRAAIPPSKQESFTEDIDAHYQE
jgi:hypothetical protein